MEEKKQLDRRSLAGLVLIVLGGLLLLSTLDVLDLQISHYIFSWKTMLIVVGLIIVSRKENPWIAYVLIAVGMIFWILDISGIYVSFGKVILPLFLIVIGVTIITRRGNHDERQSSRRNPDGSINTDYIDDVSILGGGVRVITSKNFKGGNITAIFGGSEFDMRNAEITPDGCVIDIFTIFGGTKLVVPDDWVVQSDMLAMLGGFNDKRHVKPVEGDKKKVLLLKGAVMFGGVEVKNL